MRTMAALLVMAAAVFGDTGRDHAVRKLESTRVTVDFDHSKISDVLGYLREATGLNFVLPHAVERQADADVRLKAKDLSVKSVLKLVLAPRGLAATYRDGAVVILSREDLLEATSTRMFDIRSMMVKIQDFGGPWMELARSKAGLWLMCACFVLEEPKSPFFNEEMLVDLVRSNTGGNSWQSNPNTSIQIVGGKLLVSQSPSVLRDIESFLGQLGQYQ